MEERQALLKVRNISKSFLGVRALQDVQLTIYGGEVHALIGENGAGKSTLMNIVMGLLQPDSGTMELDGKAYKPTNAHDAITAGISMIHQEIRLVPTMTVAENIWIGREKNFKRMGIIDARLQVKRSQELLQKIGLDINPSIRVSNLSVANMQLVEIARAISYNSKVIIMDEPTSALTEVEIKKLFDIIHQLTNDGIAIVFISHKLDEILTIADRVTALRDGQFIGTEEIENVTNDSLIKMIVGHEMSEMFPKQEVEIGEPYLQVRHLSHFPLFEDVNFEVRKGEILGFCGLMGAGRTEIASAIFGIDRPDSGEVILDGKKLKIRNVRDAIKAGFAMITEDRLRLGAVHRLSIRLNITLAQLFRICNAGFINFSKERELCNDVIKSIDIKTNNPENSIDSLSGGNQQKVIIGKWLLTMPQVLIMDEPTRGIDIGSKAEIHRLIGNLAKQGKAIILISSELPELMGMSDRILVVHHGKIVFEQKRGSFDQEVLMRHAFGFTD